MSITSLEDKIRSNGNPVDMLRNASMGPYQFPIKAEFTNWRDEQEAWRKTAVLLDQTHHMTDHHIEGPDVKPLVESLAINSMANALPGCRAKAHSDPGPSRRQPPTYCPLGV